MSKSFFITYRWAEGPQNGNRFGAELQKQGYRRAEDVESADIIIAHSLGCYLVPRRTEMKGIVLIGIPYWPGRSVVSGVIRKFIAELRYYPADKGIRTWLKKLAYHFWYIFTRPRYTLYAFTKRSIANLPSGKSNRVILLRAKNDAFMHPEAHKMIEAAQEYQYAEIEGSHDDCWIKPEPYIELIKKHL